VTDVRGRRVLVVDDTWVTGARARSAAAALALAGAQVVAALVIGRAVDPDASPAVARWWSGLTGAPVVVSPPVVPGLISAPVAASADPDREAGGGRRRA
jgi:phosphoribosylpyrophosphate synthetase